MGNGLRLYVRQGVVDYATARWLLLGAVPSVVAGASVAQLVLRCRVPPRVAVATSVFTLAIHALSAEPAWPVVAWSVPGVLLGSTLGSRVGRYVPSPVMEKVLGGVFGAVGLLVLGLELMA